MTKSDIHNHRKKEIHKERMNEATNDTNKKSVTGRLNEISKDRNKEHKTERRNQGHNEISQ